MTIQAQFLFRDYGITPDEVINTLADAIDFISTHTKDDDENNLCDRLDDVHALIIRLWQIEDQEV